MNHKEFIETQRQELAGRILRLPSSSPVRVAVDGITASGKTTFANDLADILEPSGRPVVRATIDGFHNPKDVRYRNSAESPESYYADSFNYQALRRVLLDPITDVSVEGQYIRTAIYDFRTEAEVVDQRAFFTLDTILLFDGVMLFRDEIDDCWDYRIYVDARIQTALERGVPRNAHTDEEQLRVGRKYLDRYYPGQRIYQAKFSPLSKADAIVLNDDPEASYIRFKMK